MTGIVRERRAFGSGTLEARSTKIFGRVWVRTWLPAWQASALSIAQNPLGKAYLMLSLSSRARAKTR